MISVDVVERAVNCSALQPVPRVDVVTRNDEYCLIALQPIMPGERIIRIDGELTSIPCRLSVQVGANLHVSPPLGLRDGEERDSYQWRFLNHDCRPNAVIVHRLLVAIRSITANEEITFDYNTTEVEMASPFKCRCGHCDGARIRGFRFLSADEKKRRKHMVDDYLCEVLEDA